MPFSAIDVNIAVAGNGFSQILKYIVKTTGKLIILTSHGASKIWAMHRNVSDYEYR